MRRQLRTKLVEAVEEAGDDKCPEDRASLSSQLFFSWFTPLVTRGFRRKLDLQDLWDLVEENRSGDVVRRFDKHRSRSRGQGVFVLLAKAFWRPFLVGSCMKLLCDGLIFVQPQLLRLMIAFIEDSAEETWRGILYAVLMFTAVSLQSIVWSNHVQHMCIIGMRMRSALISAVYR